MARPDSNKAAPGRTGSNLAETGGENKKLKGRSRIKEHAKVCTCDPLSSTYLFPAGFRQVSAGFHRLPPDLAGFRRLPGAAASAGFPAPAFGRL